MLRDSLGETGYDLLVGSDLAAELIVGGEHLRKRLALVGVERAQHIGGDQPTQLFAAHVGPPAGPASAVRSLLIPSRMRVFTVPRGVAVCSAISL